MPKPSKICATCGSEYEHDVLFCPKDGTPLGTSRTTPGEDPYLGLVIGEQIQLRQLIGIGSMGRVYRAFQRGIERDVAVKMLHRELSANKTLVTRFLREARIASRLSHPNVVQVLMAGQLPSKGAAAPIGGELYIVMEHLDGISLMSALAAADGAMPLPRALHVVLQICDAVGEAHAQSIVHRDLKPENVMLVRRGDDPDFVKVLDFGIARLDWGEESLATQAGLIFGTARYISPEGSQGEPVGPEADVYAIATILYQCLAAQTPFDADSPMALLMQHAYEPPPPVLSIPRSSYVPPPLAGAIMRNLAKNAADRASDARTFGRELVEAARQGGLSPDDLVPRSTLLGQRAAHASFVSIQRTKQMQLSPETAALIGGYASPTVASDGPVSMSSPLPGSVPPQAVGLSSSELPPTLSDEPGPRSTAPSLPALSTPAPRSSHVTLTPLSDRSTEPTLDDDDEVVDGHERRGKARLALFVVACFLGGAGIAAVGAHQLGYIGATAADSHAGYVERAERALHSQHWSTPPNDNVKDITDEGLARHPGDPALLDVRLRAAEELVTTALGRKYAGDLKSALEMASLARELAPNNTTAQHLAAELALLVADAAPLVAPDPEDDAGTARPQPSRAPPHRLLPSSSAPSPVPETTGTTPSVSSPPPANTGSAAAPPGPSATGGRWL